MANRYSIYAIGPSRGKPIKIGYTKNLKLRLIDLQTGSHEELQVWCEIEHLSLDEAKKVEHAVHKSLRDYHIRGEWFDVGVDDAAYEMHRHINTQIYAARALMCFDTTGYIEPEKRRNIGQVALQTMDNNALR